MRRTEIRRRTPLSRSPLRSRGKVLRRISTRRRSETKTYTALRRPFLTANPWCAWPNCPDEATTVQHTRGRVGALYLDVRWWLPSCWFHNGYAEDFPGIARDVGFSRSRLSA